MEEKTEKELTQLETLKLRLAEDYLTARFESFNIELINMVEDPHYWNFKFEYQSRYDKVEKTKILTIPVNKGDNTIGKIVGGRPEVK
jgi:hypothetical protein